MFEMNEKETIDKVHSRFTTIINEMQSLGKKYTTQERVRKLWYISLVPRDQWSQL